jgi:AcrR family transcriptional regulator
MPRHADPNAKDALVAAARREFATRGLRGARIEDITGACGLSKGAFYLHYPSKEALFGELVDGFLAIMSDSSEKRHEDMASFFVEYGPITRRDVEERTDRYRKLLELETREDLRVLEHMWSYRDVVGVLLRGSQGTRFEGAIWEITDREVDRVKETFVRFQGEQTCRRDIPPEIFGSLIVGTYMLLAMRMSRMTEKPDLAEWASSLHTLIREGSAPAADSQEPHKNARRVS